MLDPLFLCDLSGHLLSGSILNNLMRSKDTECIIMFLSAMPRGVSVAHIYVCFFVCFFVALRPKSTAMVIAGRSVHLTTLFPGQA